VGHLFSASECGAYLLPLLRILPGITDRQIHKGAKILHFQSVPRRRNL
jgi:hypothetical protein